MKAQLLLSRHNCAHASSACLAYAATALPDAHPFSFAGEVASAIRQKPAEAGEGEGS